MTKKTLYIYITENRNFLLSKQLKINDPLFKLYQTVFYISGLENFVTEFKKNPLYENSIIMVPVNGTIEKIHIKEYKYDDMVAHWNYFFNSAYQLFINFLD